MHKREKECLRLSEYGLRGLIYELGKVELQVGIWQSNKNNRIFRRDGLRLWG